MLHCITSNKTSSSAQPCFAMYCNCAFLWLDQIQKFVYNCRIWSCSVCKNKIMVLDSLLGKSICIIRFIVQPDDHFNTQFLENRHVIKWCKYSILWIIKKGTPYLSTLVSYGELNATNLLGMIQFKSPFYTLS